MPRKWAIFKHGKRGVTSADTVLHYRRWTAIELLRKRTGMTVHSAAMHLVKHPDAVPDVPEGGADDKTRRTYSSVKALLASHKIVDDELANTKEQRKRRLPDGTEVPDAHISPHDLRKLIADGCPEDRIAPRIVGEAEAALLTLVEIAGGESAASARVSAAVAILDRADRPPQALEHSALDKDDVLKRLMAELFGGTSFRPQGADELSGEVIDGSSPMAACKSRYGTTQQS